MQAIACTGPSNRKEQSAESTVVQLIDDAVTPRGEPDLLHIDK